MILLKSHKEFLEKYKKNPKITILSTKHGLDAFRLAADLFFIGKSLEKEDWMKQFVSEDKKTATFILYKRKLRTNFKLGFNILIGDDMFLGEQHPLDKATDLWKDYL